MVRGAKKWLTFGHNIGTIGMGCHNETSVIYSRGGYKHHMVGG